MVSERTALLLPSVPGNWPMSFAIHAGQAGAFADRGGCGESAGRAPDGAARSTCLPMPGAICIFNRWPAIAAQGLLI